MAWSDDSVTCVTVYTTLVRTEQIDLQTKFADAGPQKMSSLLFFNTAASDDIVKAQAIMQANAMDSIFTNSYGAAYKGTNNLQSSVNAMVAIMVAADDTVENLSDTIFGCYNITE